MATRFANFAPQTMTVEQQGFFATIPSRGSPDEVEKAQPWKGVLNENIGKEWSLAEASERNETCWAGRRLMVDIPQTVATGSHSSTNVFTNSLGGH